MQNTPHPPPPRPYQLSVTLAFETIGSESDLEVWKEFKEKTNRKKNKLILSLGFYLLDK